MDSSHTGGRPGLPSYLLALAWHRRCGKHQGTGNGTWWSTYLSLPYEEEEGKERNQYYFLEIIINSYTKQVFTRTGNSTPWKNTVSQVHGRNNMELTAQLSCIFKSLIRNIFGNFHSNVKFNHQILGSIFIFRLLFPNMPSIMPVSFKRISFYILTEIFWRSLLPLKKNSYNMYSFLL